MGLMSKEKRRPLSAGAWFPGCFFAGGLPVDGLRPVGPDRYDGDGHAQGFLDVRDVRVEGGRQGGLVGDAGEVFAPAGQGVVNGFEVFFLDVVGQIVDLFAHVFVMGADFDLLEAGQDVCFHHHQLRHSADHAGVFQYGQVQPAATASASGGGSVFTADLAQAVAGFVELFGGEGAGAYAGGVGFEDAEHFTDGAGWHAQPGAGSGGHRVGRGDEGVGTEIDVQHGALGSFGQYFFAFGYGLVQVLFAVDEGERFQGFDCGEPFGLQFVQVEVDFGAVIVQHGEVFVHQCAVAFHEVGQFGVAHAQAVAAGFVHVGGADAFQGGAYFGFAFGGFRGGVQQAVRGEDQVGLARDEQARGDVQAVLGQVLYFAGEDDRVDDYAVAHHVDGLFVEYARRDGVQDVFDAVEFQRVSGVGAALEAGDDVVSGGEHVHDFPFTFVPPLETEQKIYCHV